MLRLAWTELATVEDGICLPTNYHGYHVLILGGEGPGPCYSDVSLHSHKIIVSRWATSSKSTKSETKSLNSVCSYTRKGNGIKTPSLYRQLLEWMQKATDEESRPRHILCLRAALVQVSNIVVWTMTGVKEEMACLGLFRVVKATVCRPCI
jgi:hypothetical protein